MEIPEHLRHRIQQFRDTARVVISADELFAENSWIQVMMGQGIMPQSYHPVASKLTGEELDHFLSSLRDNVSKTVAQLPAHGDYIARYCAADQARAA